MQTIYLDISNKGVVPTIYAKQGDVGRKFEVVFTDSGIPYNIPTNAKISVWYEGDSGNGNYTDIGENSAIAIGKNKAVVELITQMLSEDGEGIICLVMNVGNDQIGSWNIRYLCEKVPGIESEAAKEYYTAFSKSVEGLKQITENLTLEAIGAAPAGFGLGMTSCEAITSLAALDATIKNGKYYLRLTGSEIIAGEYQYGNVEVTGHDNWDVTQTLIATGNTTKLSRRGRQGNWQPWEYENPPMIPGVEYRTTERYDGKPVYIKLCDLGALPNATTKTYEGLAYYVDRVIDATLNNSRDGVASYQNAPEVSWYVGSWGSPYVSITTSTNMSDSTARITLKYTKTTD